MKAVKHFGPRGLYLALCLWLPTTVQGVELARSTVSISGAVVKPTCKFDQGNSLRVSFSTVDVTRIASGQYKQAIPLTIKCGTEAAAITLTLKADVGFATDVVKTSASGLGIRIRRVRDDAVWKPNSSVNSSTSNDNSIEAVLVLEPGSELQAGAFSASATLSAAYD
ncbi:fimbrial protein [Metapseudomonas boanensis]|uniref:Fimbrial protein n=1 Tax=Metapseudomonas boanensis TaxID=2822138 RepID=A0ABS5XNM1_9GAMM|nr:fimbrial protein [Pseudomonas boanensis]MBT8769304.1 fimbrial protein [Pseudomonas boanensis]